MSPAPEPGRGGPQPSRPAPRRLHMQHRQCVSAMLLLLACLSAPAAAPARESSGESSTTGSSTSPLPPGYRIHADGSVTQRVCFNWSCASRQLLTFTSVDMAQVAQQMALCAEDVLYDRLQRLRIGIWQMETLAQKYQPLLANDDAINDREWGLDGRMDCIDNASNTTTYLHVLHDLGLLPGWSIAQTEVRDRFSMQVHWTAVVVDSEDTESWAVDSWFRPNAHLPFVMPLADWVNGRIAWEPPFSAWNPYPIYTNQLCGE